MSMTISFGIGVLSRPWDVRQLRFYMYAAIATLHVIVSFVAAKIMPKMGDLDSIVVYFSLSAIGFVVGVFHAKRNIVGMHLERTI